MRFPFRVKDLKSAQKNFDFLAGATGRSVRGWIDTTGPTIISGKGFTIVKNGVGDVTVTFSKSFGSVAPIVTLTPAGGGFIYWVKHFFGAPPTPTGFRAAVINNAGVLQDGPFTFHAEEPS